MSLLHESIDLMTSILTHFECIFLPVTLILLDRCQASCVAVTTAIAMMMQRQPKHVKGDGSYDAKAIRQDAYDLACKQLPDKKKVSRTTRQGVEFLWCGWRGRRIKLPLTHWGREKMAAISQKIFSNAFSWVKSFVFWLEFHWSLFPIDNKPALVQIMAWGRIGDKSLSEPILTWFIDAYMRH